MQINIITSEKIFRNKGNFFCDNIEIKNITEELNNFSETVLFGNEVKKEKFHKINLEKIEISNNIFRYLLSIYKISHLKNIVFLVISLTPYTFVSILLLKILKKKTLIYLRSDGFKEYYKKFGKIGSLIYKIFFMLATKNSNLISCGKDILRGKSGVVIIPSSLTVNWEKNVTSAKFNKLKILYVGRMRVEKGIFSLIKLIEKIKKNMEFTIVGNDIEINKFSNDKRISVKGIISDEKELVKIYDDHNIFILPSFTEGYSMVIDEALSRLRPVIIFEEIKHIIGNRKGIFVSKRDQKNLLNTIDYISSNYETILRDIKKNSFISKKKFVENIYKNLSNL